MWPLCGIYNGDGRSKVARSIFESWRSNSIRLEWLPDTPYCRPSRNLQSFVAHGYAEPAVGCTELTESRRQSLGKLIRARYVTCIGCQPIQQWNDVPTRQPVYNYARKCGLIRETLDLKYWRMLFARPARQPGARPVDIPIPNHLIR